MNRIDGHSIKDVNLALKALEAGKVCVNFKRVYFRAATGTIDIVRQFSFGNSWICTTVDNWEQYSTGRLIIDFSMHLPFSEKIELTALINNSTSGSLNQCREDHSSLVYVFKDRVLTPEANENGFLYKLKSTKFGWRRNHASVTWVIKVLQN